MVLHEIFTIGRCSVSKLVYTKREPVSTLCGSGSTRFACCHYHTQSRCPFYTNGHNFLLLLILRQPSKCIVPFASNCSKKFVFESHIHWIWKVVASLCATWLSSLLRLNECMKFMSLKCGLKQFQYNSSVSLWAWNWEKGLRIKAFLSLLLK